LVIKFPSWNGIEKVRRYQRDNQKPSIEEQAIQWPKRQAMIKNQQPVSIVAFGLTRRIHY
jgi:hypothetical protein